MMQVGDIMTIPARTKRDGITPPNMTRFFRLMLLAPEIIGRSWTGRKGRNKLETQFTKVNDPNMPIGAFKCRQAV